MLSRTTHRRRPVGFTLVELLVVIGIIALLISILLPALTRARRAANTVACQANLRSIIQGAHMYAAQWKGYFPGGSNTTGRFLFNDALSGNNAVYSNANCPTISQNWDWMSPIATVMGLKFNMGSTQNDRMDRFDRLRLFPGFRCPENTALSGPPAFTPAPPVDVPPSYAIAIYFHLLPHDPNGGFPNMQTAAGQSPRVRGFPFCTPPKGYAPQLAKVKNSSKKIFIADGARYSNTTDAWNVTLPYISGGGGAFGDAGSFTNFSNCWNRSKAPGNGGAGPIDPRILAFRHGSARGQNAPNDTYKFNAGFFDGHVETLGDLQSADPAYWLPSGSFYDPNNTSDTPLSADAKAKYGYGAATTIP